jgi:hypothetical protein
MFLLLQFEVRTYHAAWRGYASPRQFNCTLFPLPFRVTKNPWDYNNINIRNYTFSTIIF